VLPNTPMTATHTIPKRMRFFIAASTPLTIHPKLPLEDRRIRRRIRTTEATGQKTTRRTQRSRKTFSVDPWFSEIP
jgi:hypothetical protein